MIHQICDTYIIHLLFVRVYFIYFFCLSLYLFIYSLCFIYSFISFALFIPFALFISFALHALHISFRSTSFFVDLETLVQYYDRFGCMVFFWTFPYFKLTLPFSSPYFIFVSLVWLLFFFVDFEILVRCYGRFRCMGVSYSEHFFTFS